MVTFYTHFFSRKNRDTLTKINFSTSGAKTIRWLGEEALRRYLKLKPPSFVPNRQEVVHDIRKTVGGAICDPEDIIKDVLDDNDFVSIGKILEF